MLKKVKSSNIEAVGYFDGAGLFVQFKSGKVYQYPKANKELYLDFIKSDSKGKFFHKNIKHLDSLLVDESNLNSGTVSSDYITNFEVNKELMRQLISNNELIKNPIKKREYFGAWYGLDVGVSKDYNVVVMVPSEAVEYLTKE